MSKDIKFFFKQLKDVSFLKRIKEEPLRFLDLVSIKKLEEPFQHFIQISLPTSAGNFHSWGRGFQLMFGFPATLHIFEHVTGTRINVHSENKDFV